MYIKVLNIEDIKDMYLSNFIIKLILIKMNLLKLKITRDIY